MFNECKVQVCVHSVMFNECKVQVCVHSHKTCMLIGTCIVIKEWGPGGGGGGGGGIFKSFTEVVKLLR